jgi:rubrerythrin
MVPYQGEIPRDCVAYDGGFPEAGPGMSLDPATCTRLCGASPLACSAQSTSNDSLLVTCPPSCPAVGRRPPGLVEENPRAGLGEYFRGMAKLEAASVDAFRILERELSPHRLPRKLARAMRRAARDEVRHARAASALARRFGSTGASPDVRPHPRRTLTEIAIDNAKEGCVRETYGALVATYQAKVARDAQVRATMSRIARDEIRHASLSWQLDHWLHARLDRQARDEVARAKRSARAELAASLATPWSRDLVELAGLPSADVARTLLENLVQATSC